MGDAGAPADEVSANANRRDRELALFHAAERHLLTSLKVYWSRVIVMTIFQGALISVFVVRFVAEPGINALAVIFALYGLATAVITVVLAVAAVQGILQWRVTFIETAAIIDDHGVIRNAETTDRITNPTQSSVLLPVVSAITWAVLLLAYTVR